MRTNTLQPLFAALTCSFAAWGCHLLQRDEPAQAGPEMVSTRDHARALFSTRSVLTSTTWETRGLDFGCREWVSFRPDQTYQVTRLCSNDQAESFRGTYELRGQSLQLNAPLSASCPDSEVVRHYTQAPIDLEHTGSGNIALLRGQALLRSFHPNPQAAKIHEIEPSAACLNTAMLALHTE